MKKIIIVLTTILMTTAAVLWASQVNLGSGVYATLSTQTGTGSSETSRITVTLSGDTTKIVSILGKYQRSWVTDNTQKQTLQSIIKINGVNFTTAGVWIMVEQVMTSSGSMLGFVAANGTNHFFEIKVSGSNSSSSSTGSSSSSSSTGSSSSSSSTGSSSSSSSTGSSSSSSSMGSSSSSSSTGSSSSSSSTGSSSSSSSTSIMSKETWEKFFPGRWGVGDYWKEIYRAKPFYNSNMEYDLYSYENFAAAVNELQYIKLKIGPQQDNFKAVYRWDSRTDKDWVYVCNSDEWTPWGSTEEEIIDLGHFINKPGASEEDKLRELAAFLANISHEVGDSDWRIGSEAYLGLFYREEIAYEANSSLASYIKSGDVNFPPVAGKSYHGRGPIQLSWNYNYGSMSAIFLGDKDILLKDPDKVKEDGKLAFLTAMWFWMFPQGGKPSCHEVMYSDYVPGSGEKNAWGFGHTVVIINGGFESSGTMKPRRGYFYKIFADLLGVQIGVNGENIDTVGISSY